MIFSQPIFLWGLLAVAIPVVVHLFNFRRYHKVYFSNVDRLSELQAEQRRHNTLRQWLVLAMRILTIVFLVLAFAGPVIPSSKETVRIGSTVVSIYVDNSFSMATAGTEGSLLDATRQKVREVAAAYSVSDRFQLITGDMRGCEMRWLNRDELLSALDELTVSPTAPMMSEVATRQQDFMRQNSPAGANRHAYIISDFQRTTTDLDLLPSDSTVLCTLVPLSSVEADNIFIDSISLNAPAYFPSSSVSLRATLHNSGSRDAEKVPVKLMVNGRERAVATVDIAAESSTTTTLQFSLDRTGWVDGCITLEDYPITFDDSYYFTFHVGDRIRLLELDGDRPNESLARLFDGDSAIVYQHARTLQHDLTQFDILILNEIRTLTNGEVQQLAEWVAEGGSLLVIPPADQPDGLDELLQILHAPNLDRWVARNVKASLIDYSSSLYQGVFSSHTDEMEMPTVQGHYTLQANQAIRQSIITLADGTDLLCTTPVGQGRLYLFTTPLTTAYTDLVEQALFVPTLYNMALYSCPLPAVAYRLGSSDPIVLQGNYDLGSHPPTLTDGGDMVFLPDIRPLAGRYQMLLHGELTHDGIYTLSGRTASDVEHIAFNYPRRESQMDFLSTSEIAAAIDHREGYSLVRNSNKPLTDELRARDGGRPLWRLCLLLALTALATEVLILKIKR